MSEPKRKKKDLFDIFSFDEDDFLFRNELKPMKDKQGSGYSISVTYDEKGKRVVKVKTYGDVDVAELQRDIQQRYPGAKIEGLEKQPLIKVVDEERQGKQKPEKKQEEERRKEEKKEKKQPSIRIVE